MTQSPLDSPDLPHDRIRDRAARLVARIGAPAAEGVRFIGAATLLSTSALGWLYRSLVIRKVRFGRPALYSQMVRVGVRSIAVIVLVNACIGLILALQMAPPLEEFGQTDKVANVIAVAVVRELGPLICAIVLTGFAGASITAELGTMVVGEEIEALQAHALNPVRFLVLPRMLATVLCLVVLTIIGEFVAITGGWTIAVTLLDIPSGVYIGNTLDQLGLADFLTGLWKAAVFGVLLGAIACYNGLAVRGGAAGVGRATTSTVVLSIVSVIFTDLLFTAIFYKLGWT